MPLPKLNSPTYELVLPSNGQKVLFRPFTVREEKILLMVKEEDAQSQVRALRQVLDSCLLPDPVKGTKLDVNKLAMFDLDYIWLKVRSKSVEEIVKMPFECMNELPDGQTREDEEGNVYTHCGTIVHIPIDLEKIDVKKDPENDPVIKLQDDIGIKLRFPTFETVQKLAGVQAETNMDAMFEIITECVEMIFEGEKTYEREHIEKKEMVEFLESLSQPHFAKIMKFFETMPVLRHQIHFRCPKCKHEVDIVLEGTKSFLASDSATKA